MIKDMVNSNFLQYASYVIKDRAIPFLEDGLKPVQRRILHTLKEIDDGKYHKVANVVGHAMRYHPHGDASIEAALVNIAQKGFLIDQQGNFGNILTGDPASAARYIECRLTPLAKETLFSHEVTEYTESYDGRNLEPKLLPAKIPLLLMSGVEGIAVGLSTKLLPHNFVELLQAQIKHLQGESFEIYPDFPQGGQLDVSQYQRGKGKVRVRARIEVKDNQTLLIREIPFGTTTESLLASIENAIQRGKLKITQINDYTTEHVEIELKVGRGESAADLIPKLFLYTDCEVSISLSPIVISHNVPLETDVHAILEKNTSCLVDTLSKELRSKIAKLEARYRMLHITDLFITHKVYLTLENEGEFQDLKARIQAQLQTLVGDTTVVEASVVDSLINLPLRRISRFDKSKSENDMAIVKQDIATAQANLEGITSYTVTYLEGLLTRYGAGLQRKTRIEAFDAVVATHVAVQDLRVGYDAETGYIGTSVKTANAIPLSSFDKLLLMAEDGTYKVIEVPEKLFLTKPLYHFTKQSSMPTFSVLYQDMLGAARMKKFQIPKFILNKEYRYIPEGGRVLYFSTNPADLVTVNLAPAPRLRRTDLEVDFKEMAVKAVSSQGNRVTEKAIASVVKK